MTKDYKNLIVWQKAMDLVEIIYRATRSLPKEEMYGLTSQMRRSAVSIPSNIAEGCGQGTDKNFARFLSISQGSLKELETQLLIVKRLNYIDHDTLQPILSLCNEIGKMITGLQKRLR